MADLSLQADSACATSVSTEDAEHLRAHLEHVRNVLETSTSPVQIAMGEFLIKRLQRDLDAYEAAFTMTHAGVMYVAVRGRA